MLVKHKAAEIKYSKRVGDSGDLHRFDTSNRTIIPMNIPTINIKALDVTDLSEGEIRTMEKQVAEYADYRDAVINTIFSFEDWVGHAYNEDSDDTAERVKWRTFNPEGITKL